MTCYMICASRVMSFNRATDAFAAADALGGPPEAFAVSSAEDLTKHQPSVPTEMLVSLYNLAASEPGNGPQKRTITRFSDREVAIRRTWPVIEYLAKPGAPVSPSSDSPETMATATKRTRKPAAPKRSSDARPGRPSQYAGKVITKLVDKNPRREGTAGFKAWAILRSGMTYEQYIAAGGARNHLKWDLDRQRVELK
jgi:hypothetical protein